MENNALKAEQFYHDPWQRARESSSEYPPTQAFTESLRGSVAPINFDGGTDEPSAEIPIRHDARLVERPMSSGGASNTALEVLGKDVRSMMDTIQSLRHLGLEKSIPLPKIVVVGDQSTGKSSVIEGISGIKVPRSSGTCTRCPLEINLNESPQPWQVRVYLSLRFAYMPDAYGTKVNKQRPYGPWQSQPDGNNEYPFATLHRPSELTKALELAQLAVLNPSVDPSNYKPENAARPSEDMQVDFSPNVVRLDISGPRLPNLAFYDLPGMISHVGSETQNQMPRLIENLVREYIKPSNTIILLTLTMNHDIMNSKTAGFIDRVTPEDRSLKASDRTVGVFTKPDLLTPDSQDLFEQIFAGHEFKRKLGYFVVLNSHDTKITHSAARELENIFFGKKWRNDFPKLSKFKDRFTTLHLQEELSKLLAQKIRDSLPSIRNQVDQKIAQCEAELESLPRPPTGNLSLEVSQSLSDLRRELETLLKQGHGPSLFNDRFRALYNKHRSQLVDSSPRLTLITNTLSLDQVSPGSPTPLRQDADLIEIDDDDEDNETLVATPRRGQHNTVSPRKRPGFPDNHQGFAKRSRQDESIRSEDENAKIFSFDEVRSIMQSHDETGLPGSQNPYVTTQLYTLSSGHWKSATTEFVSSVSELVGQSVMSLAKSCFSNKQNTQLWYTIENIIKEYILGLFHHSGEFAVKCLRMEQNVFLLSSGLVEPASQRFFEDMMKERRVDRVCLQMQEEIANGKNIAHNVKMNRIAAARNGTAAAAEADEHQGEVRQMALTKAYYEYAANRYAEYVTLNIKTEAIDKCVGGLHARLEESLRLKSEDANEYIRRLLEIDQSVARERKVCENRLQTLIAGRGRLTQLEHDSAIRGRVCSTPSTVW